MFTSYKVQFEKVGFQSTTEDRADFGHPDSDRKLIPPPGGKDGEQSRGPTLADTRAAWPLRSGLAGGV